MSQLTEVSVVSSADEMMQLNFILGVFGLFVFADCAYVKKIHRGKLFLCMCTDESVKMFLSRYLSTCCALIISDEQLLRRRDLTKSDFLLRR